MLLLEALLTSGEWERRVNTGQGQASSCATTTGTAGESNDCVVKCLCVVDYRGSPDFRLLRKMS